MLFEEVDIAHSTFYTKNFNCSSPGQLVNIPISHLFKHGI